MFDADKDCFQVTKTPCKYFTGGLKVLWRRRELNPGPVKAPIGFLHAYFPIKFSSARQVRKQTRFAPYPLRFHLLAGAFRQAILQGC